MTSEKLETGLRSIHNLLENAWMLIKKHEKDDLFATQMFARLDNIAMTASMNKAHARLLSVLEEYDIALDDEDGHHSREDVYEILVEAAAETFELTSVNYKVGLWKRTACMLGKEASETRKRADRVDILNDLNMILDDYLELRKEISKCES